VIFPFHPIAIYTNPALLRYVLDPLFINQESGNWPQAYAEHDIGSAFPNATGTLHGGHGCRRMPIADDVSQAIQMATQKHNHLKNAATCSS